MTANKICRVCGREYVPCRSANRLLPGGAARVFRWQEVACSPACGAEYLRRIERSRGAEDAEAGEKAVQAGAEVMDTAEDGDSDRPPWESD